MFFGRNRKALMTDEALLARKQIAKHLTKKRLDDMQERPRREEPQFELMQELYDSGIGTCPCSDQPTFDPSKCNQQARQALWGLYCEVADVVNGCEGEQTCTVKVLRSSLESLCRSWGASA